MAVVSAGSSAGEADLERPSTSATSGWRTSTSAEAGARQASSASQSLGVAQTPWEESLTGQEVSVYEIDFHFLQTNIEALSRNIAKQDFNVE